MSRVSSLDSFFNPHGVAVIGASATPGKPGRTVIENLIANGFSGSIHPVNPRGGDICGQPVSSTIEALPNGIDMGIVMLPAAQTPQVVLDCAAKGMKSVVLAAGGYPEKYDKGEIIRGLTLPENPIHKVFHAGTALQNGNTITNGGRVLCATALGENIFDAQKNAYSLATQISWPNMFYRSDIGYRAIKN